jgi:hypothetical protein
MERDFPGIDPVGETYKKLYKDLYTGINKSIDQAMKTFDIVNPRYLREDVMKEDLYEMTRKYLIKHWNDEVFDEDAFNDFDQELSIMLSGINRKWEGESKDKFNIGEAVMFGHENPIVTFVVGYLGTEHEEIDED